MLTCGDSLGSMAEVAALTSELDTLRGKKSPGTIVNLLPYFLTSLTILTKERKACIGGIW